MTANSRGLSETIPLVYNLIDPHPGGVPASVDFTRNHLELVLYQFPVKKVIYNGLRNRRNSLCANI